MTIDQLKEAVQYIQKQHKTKPQFGIILGTGLGALVDDVEIAHTISYENIPHFPVSTVESHSGKLIFGQLNGKEVVVMQGRFHYYEGYNMYQVTFPVRVMKLLGIEFLFVSNASGGLNEQYEKSDLVAISDHINLNYENPLTGRNFEELGPRFPDMSQPYNRKLISHAEKIAKAEGITLKKGVYVSVPGPNLETAAEYKYLKIIGADCVGMSTVPEVLVAVHMSLPVFAVSVITDLCYGEIEPVSIETVVAAAMKAQPNMTRLIGKMIETM
ncbi:MAG: purine-nucleoside phosphorylase [Flammeovirgaceae bacterium]|jgi:purine-nucleoside phosphorylase